MFSTQIVQFLNFFDLFAYNSGFSKLSQYQNFTCLMSTFHISIAIFLTLFQFYMIPEYYASLSTIEIISESVQYSSPLFTLWLIIFDSIYHRRAHQCFWETLQEINKYYNSQATYNFRNYLIQFLEFFSVDAIIVLMRLLEENFGVGFAYHTLFNLSQIRLFYYLFCVEVVSFHFKEICKELKLVKRIHTETSTYISRLKWIREYYGRISKMQQLLNQFFGWSHVAVITYCFYHVLTELTWIYIHFNESPIVQNIRMSVLAIHCHLISFYLFHSAARCCATVLETVLRGFRSLTFSVLVLRRSYHLSNYIYSMH
ncbi:uncharacterized protein LOC116342556 isoform X2 [Contarinia nasturtii]|uniref:uncharacterized protein LOC116342556 isoform X2 n=1 Tax=Contarinia nasturtii TaxID=265458 RepID=UPI0012D409A1|nr:uncharacterized protein LOC116342556 isoform X2 [Contarinia nasturtii]